MTIPKLRPTRGLELWYSILGEDNSEVSGVLHGTIHELENQITPRFLDSDCRPVRR